MSLCVAGPERWIHLPRPKSEKPVLPARPAGAAGNGVCRFLTLSTLGCRKAGDSPWPLASLHSSLVLLKVRSHVTEGHLLPLAGRRPQGLPAAAVSLSAAKKTKVTWSPGKGCTLLYFPVPCIPGPVSSTWPFYQISFTWQGSWFTLVVELS